MGRMIKCRLRKRRKKKAFKKFLSGQPLTQNELWFIRREIGSVKIKGLVPVGRGMFKATPNEAKRVLELGREITEAVARARRFAVENKECEF